MDQRWSSKEGLLNSVSCDSVESLQELVQLRRRLDLNFSSPNADEGIHIVGLWCDQDDNIELTSNEAALSRWVTRYSPALGFGETHGLVLADNANSTFCLLLGLGVKRDLAPHELEALGGHSFAALEHLGERNDAWVVDSDLAGGARVADFAFGAVRRSYDSNVLRSSGIDRGSLLLTIHCDEPALATESFKGRRIQVEAIDVARDMVNAPPNYSTPQKVSNWAEDMNVDGLKVSVIRQTAELQKFFPGTWAVGRSSVEKPAVVVWEWHGKNGNLDIELALLGKGVTFDAGGLSLKPHDQQFHMKTDIGGAAAVAGAVQCIAESRLEVGVVGIAGFVENLPGADAIRPGDVLTLANGETVEISFPDAEGRLVLSDLLVYAESNYRPRVMIDLATLTATVIAALGTRKIGLFCPDDDLARLIGRAARGCGEPVWRLPIGKEYLKSLHSNVATFKNMPAPGIMGILEGSASVAASFLQTFVNDSLWAHLDIAGTVWQSESDERGPAGATGSAVSLLFELAREVAGSDELQLDRP